MRLVVLYEELAPYFFKGIEKFATTFNVPVMLVCKQVNPVAPFQFQPSTHLVKIIYREKYSINELYHQIQQFQPTCLFQAGWIYKDYFTIVKKLDLSCNVLLLDNQWKGTFRQILGSKYFKLKYKHLFQKAFVPGSLQKQFALHLGFDEKNIITGFYCADTEYFHSIYQQRIHSKKRNYNFLYIGRYATEKNIQMLWDCFIELSNEFSHQWNLICAGKGSIVPAHYSKIQHIGFIQPHQLKDILLQSDVFVLPSKFEPYGVVIHEVASAGLPIIASEEVGAVEYFVEHNKNGFVFLPTNKDQLKKYLKQFINLNDDEYWKMCEHSYQLSQKITTDKWIKIIYDICQ
ncbi:MAG: hypothetical protein OHK0036_06120 [Bacteroidia bacterium]